MPFGFNRGTYKRRRVTIPTRAQVARASAMTRPQVKQLISRSAETKYIDTNITDDINDVGQFLCLNSCARGDDNDEREGRRITMRSLQVNFQLRTVADESLVNACRFMIVLDKEGQGTIPTVGDIISSTTLQEFPNTNNLRRFSILYDKHITIGTAATDTDAREDTKKQWSIKRKLGGQSGMRVDFNAGDAGTHTDIEKGSLWLLYFSDQADSTNEAHIEVYTRVTFTDI